MCNELPKAGNLTYNKLNLKTKKMKRYFKWLIANSKISKAKFKIFWFIVYILMFCVVIHEAVADTPWALLGLIPLGAMMLYQWLEFKSDTTDKD